MILNIYEILDKFIQANTKEEKKNILLQYGQQYPHFLQLLKNTFDPNIQFYIKEFPKNYIQPDTFPGIRYAGIESELRRSYLFQKGNPTADSLTEEKRNQLLVQLLESFEPREADIFVKMMQKNLKIPQLTPKLIKEVFPNLI